MNLVSLLLIVFVSQTPLVKWADPPGEEDASIRESIDRAITQMRPEPEVISRVLGDRVFMQLHPYPRFREAVERNAPTGRLTIVGMEEPGERMVLTFEVLSPTGEPVPRALIYLYQTSAQGGYTETAVHVRATAGDDKYARLFGYVRTDDRGTAVINTIRPGGYPGGELPQHIHYFIRSDAGKGGGEVQFSDDPRLFGAMLERSRREGMLIVPPERRDGTWFVTARHRLR